MLSAEGFEEHSLASQLVPEDTPSPMVVEDASASLSPTVVINTSLTCITGIGNLLAGLLTV